ncbi:hypothetical protein D3C80_2225540 [compost metagenome]
MFAALIRSVRCSAFARSAISMGPSFGNSLEALRGCQRRTSIISRHWVRVRLRIGVSFPRIAITIRLVV